MKRSAPPWLRGAFVFAALVLSVVPRCEAQNLVQNPGFENGAQGFDIPVGLAAPDAHVSKTGAASLRLSNADADLYRSVSQTIPTTGGAAYRFSAQIRGENVTSRPDAEANRGAGVFLEWYDAAGAWLGGSYPQGILGTFGWTRVEGTADLPLNARRMIMGLYLRKGTTGTAWFDGLEVVSTTPLLRVFVTAPNYHGLISPGDAAPWGAELSVDRAPALAGPLRIRSRVLAGGKVVAEKLTPVPARRSGDTESVQFGLSQPPGATSVRAGAGPIWRIEVLDTAGQSVATRELTFRVMKRGPRVSIDPGGAWRVAGQPFFPLGIYCLGESDASGASLKLIHEGGFNTVLNYGYGAGQDPVAFLDRAQKYGLKVLYSLKDFTHDSYEFPRGRGQTPAQLIAEHVNLLKNHPALLGWYLNDEGGLERDADLRAMQNQVLLLDPDHPIVHVLNQFGSLDGYYDLTDVLGVDPYPIPQFPFDAVTSAANAARAASRGAKSVLLVSQAFSGDIYPNPPPGSRSPTTDEMRCLNILGLNSRPNGILFYAFMDLWLKGDGKRDLTQRDDAKFAREWPNVAMVARELQSLLPTLLHGRDVSLAARTPAPASLHFRAVRTGRITTLLVANADGKNAATLSLAGSPWTSATVQAGNATVADRKAMLEIDVPPHGSGILSLK